MPAPITLISHALCPYVQRIAIALAEKDMAFERRTVDLSRKPDWFLAVSPLGRTPVLMIGDDVLFESAAILEYLEETLPSPLHPASPVERARHRAWIGFGSECLNDIAGFYSAADAQTLDAKAASLHARFRVLEGQLEIGPWFAGDRFSLVDAVFAPVFRYFDTFDAIGDFGAFDGLSKVAEWRRNLSFRTSVQQAVTPAYADRLELFIERKGGALADILASRALPHAVVRVAGEA
ncbi:glutathione S-transferase family protein [Sulfitobacter sp. D35]|uniref:glutathione S-transferase family protein n=1 Tax=Sulfitobacter sp. D35 TaxID=3083252 RepID=UPI00296F1B19|nr:glutathione S-transferase family protein [Sulfitobacter sp. D35]MDW4500206.1 glutathione S-transferase family protein [Sulfitobacter sp. D35]